MLTGATLTIKCDVFVAEDKKIIVHRGAKLIVDGARITNWCPNTRWGGIYVHGNAALPQPSPASIPGANQAGIVYIDNYSRLEHAATAISTSAPGYAYADQVARWGGVVYARESYFINNRKAVEFMPYSGKNVSRFSGCLFQEEGDWSANTEGVTIWGCNGIEFQNCKFQDLDLAGIYGIDYAAKVYDGCVFTGNRWGISGYSTVAVPHLFDIGDEEQNALGQFLHARNIFDNNVDKDISFNAAYASPGKLTITRNDFRTTDACSSMGPNCRVDVRNNAFQNNAFYSIFLRDSGLKSNRISCNTFTGVRVGAILSGNNELTDAIDNDFFSMTQEAIASEINVRRPTPVSPKGKIRPFQGGPNNPVDNCFDVTAGTDIKASTVEAEHFTYYYREDVEAGSCYIPVVGNNNYTAVETPDGVVEICFYNRPTETPGEPPYTREDLTALRSQATSALADWQTNPGNDSKGVHYYNLLEAKAFVLDWLLTDYISQANYTEAENLLLEENTKQARQEVLGLKVLHQDWTGFANVLNTYPIENQDDDWFVQVQNINLQRLTATSPFVLSAQQESFLYQVALSFSPARGYARGLLALLKDERLDDPDPEEEGEPKNTTLVGENSPQTYNIYPNPAQDEIIIKYPSDASNAILTIYDQYGRLVIMTRLEASDMKTISAKDLHNGLYFLAVSNASSILFRSKLAVNH
jgi:hypothetical protein